MSAAVRHTAFGPFRARSFRFQWPADLATSWAQEMETIILGWYIITETRSVYLLTIYGALIWIGTLLSPMFGIAGHRMGNRRLLCMMRALYATLAALLMIMAFSGTLAPGPVFAIVTLTGLVRPSDLVMRYTLIAETLPQREILAATSLCRMTMDSARIVGALAGAGLVATLGMAWSYVAITALYAASFLLTLGVGGTTPAAVRGTPGGGAPPPASPWRDLRDVAGHVRHAPPLLAAMAVALTVNLFAYPVALGLLPYVAKEIFHTDQTGLGYLAASYAAGALTGSVILSRFGHALRPGRMMVGFAAAWFVVNLAFANMPHFAGGIALLTMSGLAQSLSLVPMSAMLLRQSAARLRGGVMGVRMLMIYGLPVGLVAAGPLISAVGYAWTITGYSIVGLAGLGFIVRKWGPHVWRRDAPANAR